jgi:hypothetical protein
MPHHGVYNDNKWMSNGYIYIYVKECGKPNAINHLEFTNVYVVRY